MNYLVIKIQKQKEIFWLGISCSTITFNAMFELLYNQQYGHLSHAKKDRSNCVDSCPIFLFPFVPTLSATYIRVMGVADTSGPGIFVMSWNIPFFLSCSSYALVRGL
jgi:hypothetical protein